MVTLRYLWEQSLWPLPMLVQNRNAMKKKMVQTAMVFILVLQVVVGCKKDQPVNMIIVTETNYGPMRPHDNGYLEIDLDQNESFDIEFFFKNLSALYGFGVQIVEDSSKLTYMHKNDSINENCFWRNQLLITYPYPMSPDSLKTVYFGFRKTLNDSNYYGWVLPYYFANDDSKPHGYYIQKTAFCTVPNQPILAGQECLILEE